MHKEEGPVSIENSIIALEIDACVAMSWLDVAHDIIDEVHVAAVPVGIGVYSSLLENYCKAYRPMEVSTFLMVVRMLGFSFDGSCYDDLIMSCLANKGLPSALGLFKKMRGQRSLSLVIAVKDRPMELQRKENQF